MIPIEKRKQSHVLLFRLCTALLIAASVGASWPRSSRHPVVPLDHPPLASRLEQLGLDPSTGFQFVAFGDQRALLGGDGPALIGAIDDLEGHLDRLLVLIDTGDIVNNGAYGDQFRVLSGVLRKVRRLPYLVAVGNHEVDENRPGPARTNTAAYLSSIREPISADRLYYRKVIGGVRFLFLDTNDWVYREGSSRDGAAIEGRARAQMDWLTRELADPAFGPGATTIVVMHHPLIQSSAKHRAQARDLWSYRYRGKRLVDRLVDGGVDLVLTGHTHTYERFTITRRDGRGFRLVNLSGRPEPAFLWFGAGERRARDIRGREMTWLRDEGWKDLEGWSIAQDEVMVRDEADQFGLFTVGPDGSVSLSMRFLGRRSVEAPVRLVPGHP